MGLFISIAIKMFFIFTPFFVLSVFLSFTSDVNSLEAKKMAVKTTLSIAIVSLILFFFGQHIFKVFGITLDAFRIGAGALLFLSALSLINDKKPDIKNKNEDPCVVPLAIPVTIGPASTGTLMVMGAELPSLHDKLIGIGALLVAVICVGSLLYMSVYIERLIGRVGISIFTKITGLVLSALSAQLIFTGVKNFLNL